MIGRTAHTLRSAATVAAPRPAYAAGVRASIATVLPLALGHLTGNPSAGTWMSLGGFNGALSDRGGSYGSRARIMAILTVGGAITAALGALVAGHFVAALIVTFVVAYVSSVVRVWGAPGVSIGGAMLSAYVVSLGIGTTQGSNPIARAAFLAVGGVWAIAIALVLWPLRPYRPARIAIADCYRALAAYVAEVSTAADERHTAEFPVQTSNTEIANVRAALENARAVLVQLRRGRPGSAERGERLLLLSEFADQLFGLVVAASELLSAIQLQAVNDAVHEAAVQAMKRLTASAREIAAGVEEEAKNPAIEVAWNGDDVRAAIQASNASVDPQYEYVATILDRAAQFASAASVSVEELNGPSSPARTQPAPVRSASAEVEPEALRPREMLRALISAESLIVQFALRVAVVATAAVALTELLDIKRGYWVTITVIVILQPYSGVTLTRAVQRVLGTVLGALVAAALGAAFHDPRAILVIAAVFVACCVALLPVNYAAFSIFLTPTFVLLAEAGAGEWDLAWVRAGDTILGGALALLGSRLLWPSPETSRFPTRAADAIRAMRAYLDTTVAHFDDRSPEASELLRSSRRAVGLAVANAEESLQRLLVEAHGQESMLAPALTLLAYLRRVTASIAALSVVRHADETNAAVPLATLNLTAIQVLDDLVQSLEAARAPASLPAITPTDTGKIGSPLVRARVERLARQIATMHDAVQRLAGAQTTT